MRTILNIPTQRRWANLFAFGLQRKAATQPLLKLAMTFGATLLLTACNHLFYFPDHLIRGTPDQLGVQYKPFLVTEPDGTQLSLWHLQPLTGSKHLGVIIQFHGNAQNMTSHVLFVAWLAEAGYDVITFDYRGYGDSTGVPDREGLLADGKAVLSWVARQPDLKALPLVLLGQSLGGTVVVPLAVRAQPPMLRAVVVDSTFDSYRHIAQGKLANIWLTWPLQVPLSYLVTDDLSPIDDAPKLRVPFLAIHGDDDPTVPEEYGRSLFAQIGSADRQFWEVPLSGHIAAFAADDSPWRDKLLAYLKARLAPHS